MLSRCRHRAARGAAATAANAARAGRIRADVELPPEEQIPAFTLVAIARTPFVWVAFVGYVWSVSAAAAEGRERSRVALAQASVESMNAAHFIYIPVCILIGVVFGWILGGRAARDAYLAELRTAASRKHEAEMHETRARESSRSMRSPIARKSTLSPQREPLREDLRQPFLEDARLRLLNRIVDAVES